MKYVKHVAVFIFIIIWAIVFVSFGYKDMVKMLGGSFGIFLFLPFVFASILKIENYGKLIIATTLFLTCLVVTNFIYSYFVANQVRLPFLVRLSIIFILIWGMLPGYLYAVYSFIPIYGFSSEHKNKKDQNSLKSFGGFLIASLWVPFASFIPLLFVLDGLKSINEFSCLIGLGGLLVGVAIFLYQSKNISSETLKYFSYNKNRPFHEYKKIGKIIKITTIIFLLVFSCWEIMYRNFWIIWGETILLFIGFIWIVYKFSSVLFEEEMTSGKGKAISYLPSVLSPKNLIIGIVFFLLMLFTLISNVVYFKFNVPI